MNKEEFAASIIRFFDERWEVYCTKPEDLIGKKVMSITNGFSSGFSDRGGQVMIIDDATEKNINFISCDESIKTYIDKETHTGWSCSYEERADKFIFYDKEKHELIRF